MSDIGNHIRNLRGREGLTQTQLGLALGLSGNSLVSRIESGRVVPTPRVLAAVAEFFDQDLEALTAMATTADGGSILHSELSAMADEANRARDSLSVAVTELVQEFDAHQENLSNFLMASKLNLVWSLPRKLKRERQARTVWVLSPALESETHAPGVRATVSRNLANGVRYRYLIPNSEPALGRARALLEEFGNGPLEIRTAPDMVFAFTIETVIYDAGSQRRLSLMVAPTRRPEFDIVLGANTADGFERSFSTHWNGGRRVEAVL